MGVKKFITIVKDLLELGDFEKTGKKKSIKRLLDKLVSRKSVLENTDQKKLDKKEKKELSDELKIITLQIKKGKKISDELNSKNKK